MRGECTPEQKAACALNRCFTDRHHLFFPKSEYQQPIEKTFRSLGENIVEMCRNEHNQLHATQQPPQKPSIETMAEAVLRSEIHLNNKTTRQLDAYKRQQEVANKYWGEIGARRA